MNVTMVASFFYMQEALKKIQQQQKEIKDTSGFSIRYNTISEVFFLLSLFNL